MQTYTLLPGLLVGSDY